MAIQKNIKINVDTGQAVKDVDKLDDSFKNLDNQTEKTSAGLKDVGENGGAIAILDSLTGGLATRVRDAYEATKLFNFSLKGTRTALIATGVGAFIVALGVIVAYWDEISDAIEGTTRRLKKQDEAYQRILGSLDKQIELNKLDSEIAIKKGESAEEFLRLEKELLIEKQKTIKLNLDNLKIQLAKENSQVREFTLLEKGLTALKAYVLGYDTIGQSIVEAYGFDVVSEIQARINELEVLAKQTELALTPEKKETEGESNKKREKAFTLDNGLKPDDAITLDSKKLLAEKTAEINDKVTKDILTSEAAILNAKRLTRDLEIQYRQQVKDASIQLASSTLNALGTLAEEGSALSKGVAVAQAIMSTYQGVNAALAQTTDPTPTQTLRFANAAAVGIAGLLNVKKILETQPISKTAPNISGGRGSAPAAPSFNLVEGTQENQIANSLNNREPVQSFVVATAVTSSQELNRNAESNGSL